MVKGRGWWWRREEGEIDDGSRQGLAILQQSTEMCKGFLSFIVYNSQSSVHSLQLCYIVYNIKCTLYSVNYILYTIQCKLYTVHYTHCELYNVHYTLYSERSTVYTVKGR